MSLCCLSALIQGKVGTLSLEGKKGKGADLAVHIGRQNSNLSVILCNSSLFYRGCDLGIE